jgi:hypothetical protein
MDDPWDNLVSGFYTDLSDSSGSGLPLNPEAAREANQAVANARAAQDADALGRALLDARDAWSRWPEIPDE